MGDLVSKRVPNEEWVEEGWETMGMGIGEQLRGGSPFRIEFVVKKQHFSRVLRRGDGRAKELCS